MMTFIPAILLAASPANLSIGDRVYGHAMGISDPVYYTLLPAKIPDCRTDEEVRKALAEKAQDLPQSCDPPGKNNPASHRRVPEGS